MKSMLILCGVVALWFSTFANYPGAIDVQALIVLSVLICSAVAAWSNTGRRRAFWIGFAATLICIKMKYNEVGLMFDWADRIATGISREGILESTPSQSNPGPDRLHSIINHSICFSVYLVAAAVTGLLCVYIYDASQRLEKR